MMMLLLLVLCCCWWWWWWCCYYRYFVAVFDADGDDVGALLFVLVLQFFLMFWGWWSWWWWGGGGCFYFMSCSDNADDVDDVVVGVGDVCWAEVGEVILKYGCIGYHCFFADARLDMIWYGMRSFYLTHFDTARNNKARNKDGQPSSKSGWILLIFDVLSILKLSNPRVFIACVCSLKCMVQSKFNFYSTIHWFKVYYTLSNWFKSISSVPILRGLFTTHLHPSFRTSTS